MYGYIGVAQYRTPSRRLQRVRLLGHCNGARHHPFTRIPVVAFRHTARGVADVPEAYVRDMGQPYLVHLGALGVATIVDCTAVRLGRREGVTSRERGHISTP
jgi:hypothetical protein